MFVLLVNYANLHPRKIENYKNYFEYAYVTNKKQNIQENYQDENLN